MKRKYSRQIKNYTSSIFFPACGETILTKFEPPQMHRKENGFGSASSAARTKEDSCSGFLYAYILPTKNEKINTSR